MREETKWLHQTWPDIFIHWATPLFLNRSVMCECDVLSWCFQMFPDLGAELTHLINRFDRLKVLIQLLYFSKSEEVYYLKLTQRTKLEGKASINTIHQDNSFTQCAGMSSRCVVPVYPRYYLPAYLFSETTLKFPSLIFGKVQVGSAASAHLDHCWHGNGAHSLWNLLSLK